MLAPFLARNSFFSQNGILPARGADFAHGDRASGASCGIVRFRATRASRLSINWCAAGWGGGRPRKTLGISYDRLREKGPWRPPISTVSRQSPSAMQHFGRGLLCSLGSVVTVYQIPTNRSANDRVAPKPEGTICRTAVEGWFC